MATHLTALERQLAAQVKAMRQESEHRERRLIELLQKQNSITKALSVKLDSSIKQQNTLASNLARQTQYINDLAQYLHKLAKQYDS